MRRRVLRGPQTRRAVGAFLVLMAIAAAVLPHVWDRWSPHNNFPTWTRSGGSLVGAKAEKHGWPAPTPHATPWPAPHQIDRMTAFGTVHFNAMAPGKVKNRNGFQIEVWRWGWPLHVSERVQYWWDWEDPALKGPRNDPPTRLLLAGAILNPAIVALAVWAPTFGLLWLVQTVRGLRRLRQARCVACGYPIGVSSVCTECGEMIAADA